MSLSTIGIVVIIADKTDYQIVGFLHEQLEELSYDIGKITLFNDSDRNRNLIRYEIDLMVKHFDIVIIVGRLESDQILKIIEEITNNEQIIKKLDNYNVHRLYYFQSIFLLSLDLYEETFLKWLKPHLIHYKKEALFSKTYEILLNGKPIFIEEFTGIKIKQTKNSLITVELSTRNFLEFVRLETILEQNYKINKIIDIYTPWQEVYSSTDPNIQQSLEMIEQCFNEYSPENTFLCFNGGKDCTVLLHLIQIVLKKNYPNYCQKLLCMYVQSQYPFREQDEFIEQCRIYYNLNVLTIQSTIKDALKQVLQKFPNLKACFMGTRRTDPYSQHLNTFQATDPDWPQVMRVSPLLEWHYSDIWDYLLYFKVPYCILYDLGYTSLGNYKNTVRNSSLCYYNIIEDKETYLPAYKLLKETNERNGREGGNN